MTSGLIDGRALPPLSIWWFRDASLPNGKRYLSLVASDWMKQQSLGGLASQLFPLWQLVLGLGDLVDRPKANRTIAEIPLYFFFFFPHECCQCSLTQLCCGVSFVPMASRCAHDRGLGFVVASTSLDFHVVHSAWSDGQLLRCKS